MKIRYEGLFIFPETLEEAQLDQSIEAVKAELEKLGGNLESSTRIGKRPFARPLKKKKTGSYVVIVFRLDGGQIDAFQQRLKLATNVFRVQFMQKDEKGVIQEA